jgi:hypothetical protein
MNIIGPYSGDHAKPHGSSSFNARGGWLGQFFQETECGPGLVKGAGTTFPLSMPQAQAFRYWWAAKRWKITATIAISQTVGSSPPFVATLTRATGFLPYGVGDRSELYGDLGPNRVWLMSLFNLDPGGGDSLLAPTIQERYRPAWDDSGSVGIENWFEISGVNPLYFDIFGCPGDSTGDVPFSPPGGILIDVDTPGNVYPAILLNLTTEVSQLSSQRSPISGPGHLNASAFNATLDGMNIPMYYDAGDPDDPVSPVINSITGNIDIVTSDTA